MWPFDTESSPVTSTTYTDSSAYTWSCWNEEKTACGNSDGVWNHWITEDYTGTVTATGTDITLSGSSDTYIWTGWVNSSEEYEVQVDAPIMQDTPQVDQEERRRRDEENERRYQKMQEKKEKAEKVARELLMELIGKEELETYNETGRLFVKGKDFDYLLSKEGKVQRLEKDKVIDLCIHLRDKYSYPNTDNLIGLKLLIENNEEEFIEKANVMREHDRDDNYQVPRSACAGG